MILSMATLPRLELPNVNFSAVIDLARYTATNLGYTRAHSEVQNLRLLQVLASLNILPFVPTAVTEYKRQQRAKARSGVWGLKRFNIKWRISSLRQYEGVVPFQVLDVAKRVHDAAVRGGVGHDFHVDYLGAEDLEREVYDPFLCVSADGGPRHRIAVWDEPDFKF